MDPESDLTGKILIAMPDLADPRFRRSVVLVCAHGEDGAMGLVLNRPIADIGFRGLLEQLKIDGWEQAPVVPVRLGGPVEPGRGFVLHNALGHDHEGTMAVGPGLEMTTTRDILEDLARGRGPESALLALGYAGWGAGQLDAEIKANGWLVGEMRPEYAFGPSDTAWQAAIRALGVDPLLLSGTAGHA